MRIRRPLLASLLSAAAFAAPAAAQAAPPSSADRAAAREFAAATARFEAAARLQKDAVAARVKPLVGPGCFGPSLADERLPKRATDPLATAFLVGVLDGLVTPLRPAFDGFVAELGRVSTHDRVLRSGRAAWRTSVRQIASLPAAPADLCAQIAAWRAAGYPAASAPRFDVAGLGMVSRSSGGIDRKLRAAARRLRALGVPRAQAQRFTGEAILEEVSEDLFEDDAQGAMAARLAR